MRQYNAPTMTALHDIMCSSLITANKDQLDIISTVDVQIHEVIAQADSMDWEFDLKNMWLTKGRWAMMVNQYLDPDDVTAWVNQITSKIGLKKRGVCVLRTKTVAARGGEATGHTNKETRRWGSCMLAVSYKAMPVPTIALHSRTSYLGYIGALDLSVAYMLAKTLADAMGVDVKKFRFVWYIEAIQWHNFKSMAFLLNHPEKKRRKAYRRLMMKKEKKLTKVELGILERSPALTLTRKWLAKVIKEDKEGVTYGDMTYNTYRRIRRRWHTEVHSLEFAKNYEGWSYYKRDVGDHEAGDQKEFFKAYNPLPSVPISSLDLSALTKKGAQLQGQKFDHDSEGIEDDDDDD